MAKWVHFTDSEVRGLNNELVKKLDEARGLAGIPFIITSGFRTPEENQSIPGSVSDSAHLKGLAVDLRTNTSSARFKIVKALLDAGFVRMEISDTHTHVDMDKTKPQKVMWLYL